MNDVDHSNPPAMVEEIYNIRIIREDRNKLLGRGDSLWAAPVNEMEPPPYDTPVSLNYNSIRKKIQNFCRVL